MIITIIIGLILGFSFSLFITNFIIAKRNAPDADFNVFRYIKKENREFEYKHYSKGTTIQLKPKEKIEQRQKEYIEEYEKEKK